MRFLFNTWACEHLTILHRRSHDLACFSSKISAAGTEVSDMELHSQQLLDIWNSQQLLDGLLQSTAFMEMGPPCLAFIACILPVSFIACIVCLQVGATTGSGLKLVQSFL